MRGTDVSTELQEQNGESLMEIVHWILMKITKSGVAEVRRCPRGPELTRKIMDMTVLLSHNDPGRT